MVRSDDDTTALPSGLLVGPNCPTRLHNLFLAGHPLLMQARASTPSGEGARSAVAQNVGVAANEAARYGLFPNLPDLLPSARDLAAQLRRTSDVQRSVDEEGHVFENRFLVLQSPRCPDIWMHLSCGSGRKIDEATWHQPVARHAGDLIGRLTPAIVVAAEVTRWTRKPMGLAAWLEALERLERVLDGPPFVVLADGRAEELTSRVKVNLIEEVTSGADESRRMLGRTRRALRAKVPVPDEGGVALYPFSQAPPPPLATAWRSDGTGGRGEQIVFIDTPAVRETLTGLTYGLPQVFEGDGVTPVCQLAIVRFFAQHRGQPDWPAARLARHLAVMGYSTEGLRRQRRSRSATYRDGPLSHNQVWRILHSLESAREFYRTNELWRRVGDDGDLVLATRMPPPDGESYMEASDYARIRTLVDSNQIAYTRAHRWTFGHLPARVGTVPAKITVCTDGETAIYRFRADAGHTVLGPPAVIPADDFALSLLRGLLDHAQDLTPFVSPPDQKPTTHAVERDRLAAALDQKRRAKARLYAEIFPADGVPRLHGPLFEDANADYNRLSGEIDEDTRVLSQTTALADQELLDHSPRTLAVEDLMAAVVGLRDPGDVTYQPQWRRAVTNLEVAARVASRKPRMAIETRWAGTILLQQGEDVVSVPFTGSSTRLCRSTTNRDAELIDRLRSGTPLPLGGLSAQPPTVRSRLRAALGVPSGPIPLLTVRDPRLLQVGMAVLYPPLPRSATKESGPALLVSAPLTARQLASAARRLGVALDLVKRVVSVTGHHDHKPNCQRAWRASGDAAIADLCEDVSRANGTIHIADYSAARWATLRHAAKRCHPPDMWSFARGEISVQPCPWCGVCEPMMLTIREATEMVCAACRRDRTGIDWPSEPYEEYRCLTSDKKALSSA